MVKSGNVTSIKSKGLINWLMFGRAGRCAGGKGEGDRPHICSNYDKTNES